MEKLNAAINEALQSPEMIASMKKLGFEVQNWLVAGFRGFCRGGNSALDRGGEGIRREIPMSPPEHQVRSRP